MRTNQRIIGVALAALLVLVSVAPAWAQSDTVAAVKSSLQARGVSLADACGAFQITKRVAWQLRSTGAGLLAKPSGNNCDGFAVDIIVFPDGHAFDILSDAGGANGPNWGPIEPVEASRWRAPSDPGDAGGVVAGPAPVVVQAPAVDLSGVLAGIGQVGDGVGAPAGDSVHAQNERTYRDLVARLEELRAQNAALAAQLKAHDESPTWAGRIFGNRYTQIVMGAAAAWFTAQQTGK